MCEIFPEVNTCCLVTSVRIGMLLISILAIMSGVVVLSVMEKSSNINMGKVENLTYIKGVCLADLPRSCDRIHHGGGDCDRVSPEARLHSEGSRLVVGVHSAYHDCCLSVLKLIDKSYSRY
ncbi:unnamed protein product [Leptidea sinapis]|uniref:Uncharacterized protein n=1 Tax=Leptidea sinapis TaxID=189913 RepID=A0A5E4QPA0_9NEOP|nr:unnamed protein product [Leptidea sinapis]